MDATDKKILDLLQTDASLTVKQIAEQIPLSATPCWKRDVSRHTVRCAARSST